MQKKNENGMTLVEVVVSMAILGIVSTMMITCLTFAINANRQNYDRNGEVSKQQVAVDKYDPSGSFDKSVVKNRVGNTTSNKVNLSADFGTTLGVKWDVSNINTFKAAYTNTDKKNSYQLKCIKPTDTLNIDPDPVNSVYVVTLYNDSSTEMKGQYFMIDKDGSSLISPSGIPLTGADLYRSGITCIQGGQVSIGINAKAAKDGIHFTISPDGDSSSTPLFEFKSTNLENYMLKNSDGSDTGNIIIHYTDSGFMNQKKYDESLGG